jgi:hypothetical protein
LGVVDKSITTITTTTTTIAFLFHFKMFFLNRVLYSRFCKVGPAGLCSIRAHLEKWAAYQHGCIFLEKCEKWVIGFF